MSLRLTAVQRRVLGVLIEKSLTTPGGYPLTLNSIVVGCNQLTCREPVMKVTDDDVAKASRELGALRLAAEAEPVRGSRVERYRHRVEETMRWNVYQQAVMAELLLRGPQTAGELKTNASRMSPLPDLDAVGMLIEDFTKQDLVRELPRQPGKSAVRFDHLLYAEERIEEPAVSSTPPPPDLAARVSRLENELAALRRDLEAFKRGS